MTTVQARYDVGDLARITNEPFVDATGAHHNPDAVTITVETPSAATAAYVYGTNAELVRDAAGEYHIDVDLTEAGTWRYRWVATGTAQTVEVGAFFVAASTIGVVADAYATAEELKHALSLDNETNFADDEIALAVVTASRAIDRICRRRFYLDANANQIRYYTPDDACRLKVDDLVTLTTLQTDADGDGVFEQTWTANTDYLLEPLNAAAESWPYTTIRVHPRGVYYLPQYYPKTVKVTGKFGWPAVPEAIKQATLMVAAKLIKRTREAPFGIAGFGMDGAVVRIANSDPDVCMLIDPYIRGRVAVA